MYRILTGVLMTALIGVLCAYATPGFRDVLDTPAVKSPLAEKGLLNGIVWAGNRLVSVGQRGNIIYSDDRGKSWTQAVVPVSSDLVAVYFPSAKKGWAVGHDGVALNSVDGGVTWVKQFDGRAAAEVMQSYYTAHPPAGEAGARVMSEVNRFVQEGPDKPFLDVWFEDENNGFIVGAFNMIFNTADGGKIWVPWFDRTDNPGSLHLYAIKRVGQDIYIAGEQGLVMRLDRATGKFRRMTTPYQGTFFGITGNDTSVLAFGMRGNTYRSTDRGASWHKIETGVAVGLTGSAVAEDGRIILVSQAGNVLVSKDGSASFIMAKVDTPFLAAAVVALDGNGIVLAGLGGVQVQTIK
jgi:photosystem II stability/assembly factor-like uncharacterized protein